VSFALRPERNAACASDLRFDACLAGELGLAERAALMAHVAACARCKQRLLSLERNRQQFASSAFGSPRWLDAVEPRACARHARAAWLVLAVLAGAACVVLAFSVQERVSERIKGEEYVHFFVKRGNEVRRGTGGSRLLPGDQLRFAYTSWAPRYLAILSLDAAGLASVYYPESAFTARVEPGTAVLLPSAVELDGTLGDERIAAFFCETSRSVSELREWVSARSATERAPANCSVDSFIVTKEPAVR